MKKPRTPNVPHSLAMDRKMRFFDQYPWSPKEMIRACIRKKRVDANSLSDTQFKRCLSILDLTALGVGGTLGLGLYIIAGNVANKVAGPSVILSFLIAGIASFFAAFCYAEFGSRVPKAGSAYIFSYVTMGELLAFIIGWNLILEYAIGNASVARGYSEYINSLTGKVLKNYLLEKLPINIPNMSAYPDFLAFAITMFLTGILSFGAKESSRFNNIFTAANLLVVITAVAFGLSKVDFHNWNLGADELPKENSTPVGVGGFFPFGVVGMIRGASKCFYAFVGFDFIATSGEEAKNPKKAIPLSILLSLVIVFTAYLSISCIQTLMVPYYMQVGDTPLPSVFRHVGYNEVAIIITIGALFGLFTSLIGGMFPLPRVIYAMAKDGLIYKWFSNVNKTYKTPLVATVFAGLLTGTLAMLLNVDELADMMSIGTLLAYTLVAASILVLRYQVDQLGTLIEGGEESSSSIDLNAGLSNDNPLMKAHLLTQTNLKNYSVKEIARQCFNLDKLKKPSGLSSLVSNHLIFITILFLIAINAFTVYLPGKIASDLTIQIVFAAMIVLAVFFGTLLRLQPSYKPKIAFRVPFVPLVPLVSIFINIQLLLNLSAITWIRFSIWMALGFFIYFTYGVWKSTMNQKQTHDSPEGLILQDVKAL